MIRLKTILKLSLSILIGTAEVGSASSQDVEFEDPRPDVYSITQTDPRTLLELRKAVNEISKSHDIPINEILDSKSDTVRINLSSGEDMPVVYGLKYNPTSVEFLDVTGEPWPIRKYKGYNGAFLDIEDGKDDGGHILFLSPKKNYGEAVVAVLLDGLPTAINFKVKADNSTYHRVKKIQVMRLGTKTPITNLNLKIAEQAGQQIDDNLLSASYGVRPNGFKTLITKNDQVIAWSDDKTIYVYTSLNPILPNPVEFGSGQNPGWRAFSFPMTSRLTMSNDIGSIVEISLSPEVSMFTSSGERKKKMIEIDSEKSLSEIPTQIDEQNQKAE